MSDFMRSMNASAARQSRGRGRELQANICVQIKGFDLQAEGGPVVVGVAVAPAWIEGEDVRIRMQTEEECLQGFRSDKDAKANAKFFKNRPTIEKLANGYKVGANNVPAMREGGFLMMYGCLKDGKGVEGEPSKWKAQYPENFGNDPSRDVVHGVARISVKPAREVGGRQVGPQGKMELLQPAYAQVIPSIDDLRSFYADWMHGDRGGVQCDAFVALRVCETIQKDGREQHNVKSGYAFTPRGPVTVRGADGQSREIKVPMDDAAAWERLKTGEGISRLVYAALANDMEGLSGDALSGARALAKDLADGALFIEAIPGRVIPIIGSSLEDVMNPGTKLANAAARCVYKDHKGVEVGGFVKMTTGTFARPVGEGVADSICVTSFTTDVGARAVGINNVITSNVSPVWGQQRERTAEQSAEAAAAAGGVDANPGRDRGQEGYDDSGNDREHQAEAAHPVPGM